MPWGRFWVGCTMRAVWRHPLVFFACLLSAGLAWAGRPFVDETTRLGSSDSGPPAQFEWMYEGLAGAIYLGLIFATAFLPEKIQRVATPLALLAPVLLWAGIATFRG